MEIKKSKKHKKKPSGSKLNINFKLQKFLLPSFSLVDPIVVPHSNCGVVPLTMLHGTSGKKTQGINSQNATRTMQKTEVPEGAYENKQPKTPPTMDKKRVNLEKKSPNPSKTP